MHSLHHSSFVARNSAAKRSISCRAVGLFEAQHHTLHHSRQVVQLRGESAHPTHEAETSLRKQIASYSADEDQIP